MEYDQGARRSLHHELDQRVKMAKASGHLKIVFCPIAKEYKAHKMCHHTCACLPTQTPPKTSSQHFRITPSPQSRTSHHY